jgi:hypothetical protein
MHPVTRLGRVIQQLQSFGDLHAGELDALALELPDDIAARVRIYRDVQRSEAAMVIDELVDIQAAMAESAPPPPEPVVGDDPAVNSPRRAKWLAEQAAEAERLKQPISRRDFFAHGPAKGEDETSPA